MIPIDELLAKFETVREDGHGGWMVSCPAHGDKNPSMHVSLGNDGRILIKCHAGCATEDVLAAIGLKMRDLMPDRPGRSRGKREGNWKVFPADTPVEEIVSEVMKSGKKNIAKPKKRQSSCKSTGADGSAKGDNEAGSPRPSFVAPKKPRDRGRHVCYYEYQNEDGAIIYRIDRRVHDDGSKDFNQQHPDPNSRYGWAYGCRSAGIAWVPFRLPRVIAAAKAGKNVLIVEGEKDVISVEKNLGVVATCNTGGAGKWVQDWAKWFDGVPKVLIIADKDPQFKIDARTGEQRPHWRGQRHAVDVELKLRAGGYKGVIRKIVMPDVVDANGETIAVKDFTDWVEARRKAGQVVGKSAFAEVLEAAPDWPDEWSFTDADLTDLSAPQKKARPSLSSTPELPDGGVQGWGEKAPEDGMGEAGRFGRLVPPRAPLGNARIYEVDLHIDKQRRARFKIGVDHFQFEPWRSDDGGKTFQCSGAWNVMHGPLSHYIGMAEGCLFSFCDNDRKAYKNQMGDLTCKIVVAWLRARGRFFADFDNPCYESSMYFNDEDGMLYTLHGAEFQSYLATEANITRKLKTFDLLMSVIDDLALNPKETPRVVPSRQWERKDKSIYLSNGDSEMYRIADGRIDLVPNGTDGVLFLRGFTFEPWKLQSGAGLDPFANAIAFKTAAWTDDNSLMNIRLWYLNLFACHKNKPLLLIEGPAGSGKTTIARLVKGILAMRDRGKPDTNVNVVNNTDKAAEDFWVIVHNGRLEVFDNLDQKIKWANNELQTVSTGGSHKGRKLYATDDTYILYPNSYIILTSNNPIFATEGGGLPDRIIQAHIGLGRKESLDNELTVDIAERRDEFLTWTARTLSAALADDKPVDQSVNKRHPDYGVFSVKCSRALGCEQEAIRAMGAAEIDKAVLPLMNETVAKEIYTVLLHQEPVGSMKFTAGEMSDAIIKRIGDENADDRTRTIYGSRRIGKALSTFRKEFGVIFRMRQPRMLEGKTLYEFEGLTPQGQAIVTAGGGGSVGFEGQNGESPYIREGADTLGISNPPNPPNPPDTPYARAGAQDVHSLSKENESIGEDESEDFDDVDF